MAAKGAQNIRKGLQEDINNITEDFSRMVSVRFVDFSRLWREHSFSFVFTYKSTESELREFIEEAYLIVLEPLNRTVNPERAILILYLVYCFYMCQPISPKIPIKLNLTKYKAFRSLFQESSVSKHLDACYIWMKLLSLGAFHLVEEIKSYGPLTIKKDPTQGSSSSRNNFSLDGLHEFESEMERLKNLHHSYLALKESLEGDDVAQIKEMTLVRDDIFREFANILEKSTDEESNSNNQDGNSLATTPF